MLSHCRRSGCSLLELVVVLSVSGVVLTAVGGVVLRQQRTYSASVESVALRREARQGAATLAFDLRALAPGSGDLYTIGSAAIELRASAGVSVLCDLDSTRTRLVLPRCASLRAPASPLGSPRPNGRLALHSTMSATPSIAPTISGAPMLSSPTRRRTPPARNDRDSTVGAVESVAGWSVTLRHRWPPPSPSARHSASFVALATPSTTLPPTPPTCSATPTACRVAAHPAPRRNPRPVLSPAPPRRFPDWRSSTGIPPETRSAILDASPASISPCASPDMRCGEVGAPRRERGLDRDDGRAAQPMSESMARSHSVAAVSCWPSCWPPWSPLARSPVRSSTRPHKTTALPTPRSLLCEPTPPRNSDCAPGSAPTGIGVGTTRDPGLVDLSEVDPGDGARDTLRIISLGDGLFHLTSRRMVHPGHPRSRPRSARLVRRSRPRAGPHRCCARRSRASPRRRRARPWSGQLLQSAAPRLGPLDARQRRSECENCDAAGCVAGLPPVELSSDAGADSTYLDLIARLAPAADQTLPDGRIADGARAGRVGRGMRSHGRQQLGRAARSRVAVRQLLAGHRRHRWLATARWKRPRHPDRRWRPRALRRRRLARLDRRARRARRAGERHERRRRRARRWRRGGVLVQNGAELRQGRAMVRRALAPAARPAVPRGRAWAAIPE